MRKVELPIANYHDLRVWQEGVALSLLVYRVRETFPSEERYGLTSQMRRASVSIPSNIAEGHTRNSTGEFIHYVSIARASLAELETQSHIATKLGYLSREAHEEFIDAATQLGKQLITLRKSLIRRLTSSSPTPDP